MLDYFCNALVVEGDVMWDTALAAEIQNRAAVSYEAHMAVQQRGQAKALIVTRIFNITDANARGVQDADKDRQDLLSWQSGQCQITCQLAPQPWQRLGESDHAVELGIIACAVPFVMVPILLSTARFTSGGLQMTAWVHADPDIVIGRRNRQPGDSLEFSRSSQLPLVGQVVSKALAGTLASIAGSGVGYINQAGALCHMRGLSGGAVEQFDRRAGFSFHLESIVRSGGDVNYRFERIFCRRLTQ